MVELLSQKSFRAVQSLPFCYLCGKQFSAGNVRSRDHVPPECLFQPIDREPLLLPTHLACNKSYELIDEKMGQLIGLRYGKVPSPEHRRLKFTLSPSDVTLGAVANVNIVAAVWRWVAGFHSALYREPAIGIKGSVVTPFPIGRNVNGRIVIVPIRPQQEIFVRTIRLNRFKENLDRIECNKGKLTYECVWCQSDNNGPWLCMFALDIYDWKDLGRTPHLPARGCAGYYVMPSGAAPVLAMKGKSSTIILPDSNPLDAFGS
jgi:hypothetical protein